MQRAHSEGSASKQDSVREDVAMPDAMWIACSAGCGGDMKLQAGNPPRYVCQECASVQPGAFTVEADGSAEDGIIADLGLYEDLLQCIRPREPWLEYGVIEYRYRLAFPHNFKELVRERGHRRFPVGNKTASKLIGQALGILADRDVLVKHVGGAGTGFWHYNDPSHWYARHPRPDLSNLITWTGFLAGELDGVIRNEDKVMSEAALRNANPD
jgi:hypothetical protein